MNLPIRVWIFPNGTIITNEENLWKHHEKGKPKEYMLGIQYPPREEQIKNEMGDVITSCAHHNIFKIHYVCTDRTSPDLNDKEILKIITMPRKIPKVTNIHVERARHNITQGDLAKAVGTSRQSIVSIESGEFVPGTKLGLKICQYFKVKFEYLFANYIPD